MIYHDINGVSLKFRYCIDHLPDLPSHVAQSLPQQPKYH